MSCWCLPYQRWLSEGLSPRTQRAVTSGSPAASAQLLAERSTETPSSLGCLILCCPKLAGGGWGQTEQRRALSAASARCHRAQQRRAGRGRGARPGGLRHGLCSDRCYRRCKIKLQTLPRGLWEPQAAESTLVSFKRDSWMLRERCPRNSQVWAL